MSEIKVDAIQGTSGTDTAITLSGANATVGGTLAVTGVHTVGTNAVVTTGSNTTNISSSSIKAYLHFDGSDNSIGDSLNIGSVTDNGTGNYVYNYTNNFDSDEHCFAGMCDDIGYGAQGPAREIDGSGTGSLEVRHYAGQPAYPGQEDPADTGCIMIGDLA